MFLKIPGKYELPDGDNSMKGCKITRKSLFKEKVLYLTPTGFYFSRATDTFRIILEISPIQKTGFKVELVRSLLLGGNTFLTISYWKPT